MAPEVAAGDRRRKPERGTKPRAATAGEFDRPYAQKPWRGRQITRHGCFAGPNPRSRGQTPNDLRQAWRKSRDDETRGQVQGKTARGFGALKDAITRKAEQSCEGYANPMSVAGKKIPDRLR
jgi:hypothetical protein